MSEILVKLLDDLEEEELKEFLRATTLITDPLGQALLKMAALDELEEVEKLG